MKLLLLLLLQLFVIIGSFGVLDMTVYSCCLIYELDINLSYKFWIFYCLFAMVLIQSNLVYNFQSNIIRKFKNDFSNNTNTPT